jgi:hypothetical protein
VGPNYETEAVCVECLGRPWSTEQFLCTGGVSYALYISLLISKLSRFSGPAPSDVPCNGLAPIKGGVERYEVNTLCTAAGRRGKRYKVNTLRTAPPLDWGKSITGTLEGEGPEHWYSFGPWNGNERNSCTYNYQCNCFFIWRLDLMILMGANPLQEKLEGVGPENREFFGP